MTDASGNGARRALWAAGAALFVIVVSRGALPAPVVVLGAVAAFVTVMLGLRPDEEPAKGPAAAAPAARAPREATDFEKAAMGAAPAAVPAPAPAPSATPEPTDQRGAPDLAAAAIGAPSRPVLLDAARDGGPDDLKRIRGVGPKLEAMLHRMGVFHFDQVAGWGPSEVAWVDDNLEGFKGRVIRDDWVAQARLLAGGGEIAFSARTGRDDAQVSQG